MPKRTILCDAYNHPVPKPGAPGGFESTTRLRGEVVDFSADEAARGDALGVLGPADSAAILAAQDAAVANNTAGLVDEDELRGYSVPQLSAYVTQHPDQLDLVLELEQERPTQRAGVMELEKRRAAMREAGHTAIPQVG